jgi:hypothetical protein
MKKPAKKQAIMLIISPEKTPFSPFYNARYLLAGVGFLFTRHSPIHHGSNS